MCQISIGPGLTIDRYKFNPTKERMRQFDTYELSCAVSVHETLSDKFGGVEEVLTFILKKQYIQETGAPAALFECCMDFTSKHSKEEPQKMAVVLE